MHWTDEDSQDVLVAAAALRRLADRLDADSRNRRAGGGTRALLDAALTSLLDLDDVYCEGDDGRRLDDVWKRARLTVGRKG